MSIRPPEGTVLVRSRETEEWGTRHLDWWVVVGYSGGRHPAAYIQHLSVPRNEISGSYFDVLRPIVPYRSQSFTRRRDYAD